MRERVRVRVSVWVRSWARIRVRVRVWVRVRSWARIRVRVRMWVRLRMRVRKLPGTRLHILLLPFSLFPPESLGASSYLKG